VPTPFHQHALNVPVALNLTSKAITLSDVVVLAFTVLMETTAECAEPLPQVSEDETISKRFAVPSPVPVIEMDAMRFVTVFHVRPVLGPSTVRYPSIFSNWATAVPEVDQQTL
jgi:hypothetical protein